MVVLWKTNSPRITVIEGKFGNIYKSRQGIHFLHIDFHVEDCTPLTQIYTDYYNTFNATVFGKATDWK